MHRMRIVYFNYDKKKFEFITTNCDNLTNDFLEKRIIIV